MTERDLWNRVLRPVLHDPPNSVAYKVQDAFVKGLPDVVANLSGRTIWLELKVLKHAPVRASSPWRIGVTMEQRRWLNAWNRAAGGVDCAFIFLWLNREKTWFTLDPSLPEEVAQEDFDKYVLATGSRDQLKEYYHGEK